MVKPDIVPLEDVPVEDIHLSSGVKFDDLPTPDWEESQLVDYCRHWLRHDVMAIWRVGKALIAHQSKYTYGYWGPFLERIGLNKTTASRYIRVAKEYAKPSDLPNTIDEAYVKLGLKKKALSKEEKQEYLKKRESNKLEKFQHDVRLAFRDETRKTIELCPIDSSRVVIRLLESASSLLMRYLGTWDGKWYRDELEAACKELEKSISVARQKAGS